jgi:predicted Holliday junction resolvase-like endonuclease
LITIKKGEKERGQKIAQQLNVLLVELEAKDHEYRKELKKEQNNRRIKQDQKQFKAIMKKSKKLKEKEKGIRSWRRFPKRKKFLS